MTVLLNLENAERVAARAMANVHRQRALIVKTEVIGINSIRLRAALKILEQTHTICVTEVTRLQGVLAAMPLH